MTRRAIVRLVPLALAGAVALSAGASTGTALARESVAARLTGVVDATGDAGAIQKKGRYKKVGDKCVWDANDTGPNQCTPPLKGRFKKDGNKCVWDANDEGPNQCRPANGRFKKEGSRCVWVAGDNGPDQCDPRR